MAITRSVGFAVSVLVARRLGAENLGVYQQVAVLVTVLASVATWGMPVSIIPQLACSANDDERRSLIHASLLAAFGIALVLALFLVVLSPYCVQLLLHHPLPGVLRLAAVGVVFLSGSVLTVSWLQGLNHFRALAVTSVISSVAGGFVIVFLTYSWGVAGTVFSICVVAFLFMLSAWIYNRGIRFILTRPLKGVMRTMPRLLSTGTATLAGGLPAVTAPFFFTLMLGARGMNNAGYFALSQTVFQILLFLPNALAMALLPPLSRLTADDSDAGGTAFAASLNVCGSIVLILSSVVVGLLPWIVPLLYGSGFEQGVPMIAGYAMAAPAAAINIVIVQFLLAQRYFWKAAAFNALWLIMSVSITALLITKAGPAWAGAGLVCGHVISMLSAMYVIRRSQPYVARILGRVTTAWMIIAAGYLITSMTGIVPLSLSWMLLSGATIGWMWRRHLTKAAKLLKTTIRRP